MEKIIYGIQQVGIGVSNLKTAWKWYKEYLGFDIRIFEDNTVAELMLPYTGGEPQQRHAALALNMQGGGGMEIWQYKGRTPQMPEIHVQIGDYGIFAAKLKSPNVQKAYEYFKAKGVEVASQPNRDCNGNNHFFIKDPFGNYFDIYEDTSVFVNKKRVTSGMGGALVGVSKIEDSLRVYQTILGYDKVVCDKTGKFDDLTTLPGGDGNFRRVLLTHSQPRSGGFAEFFGPSFIELVQCTDRIPSKIFKNRFWGDLGFIHLCFDMKNMDALEKVCNSQGFPFTVNSNVKHNDKGSFDMGEAAGHFTYIEDPDGTLIEFVEAHRVPLVKPLGIQLNMDKRDPHKPIPRWIIKMLSLKKANDI
ncbi:MAG: VOC family protein [Bacteroidales bacterium]|nr:VOC family protein [Bacteroidales bacterium]